MFYSHVQNLQYFPFFLIYIYIYFLKFTLLFNENPNE